MTAAMALILAISAQDPPARVPHPAVPCWSGERTWAAPGERQSEMVVFDTRSDVPPYLITHDRDQIRTGAELTQDYNFIDYWFGEPAAPIRARYYFRKDDGVAIVMPGSATTPLSLAEARTRLPTSVLCYLQRRFDRIEVLVESGYELLWARPQ